VRDGGEKMTKTSQFVLAAICILLLTFNTEPGIGEVSANVNLTLDDDKYSDFENQLEVVREALKIPGMSAAVVQDQELIWTSGFGYADLENEVPATPDTPFGLASVTKPISAVLTMQLVEEGLIDLDAPVSEYGIDLGNEAITVRHLLTHTSEGIPGTSFAYNGNRYAYLGGVMEKASGKTFAALLRERIISPLELENTALNPINNWGGSTLMGMRDFEELLGWGKNHQDMADVYRRLARPYQLDGDTNIIAGMYPLYHSPAAGLNSSVSDLARFDIALDQGILLDEPAKAEMFSPAYSTYKGRNDLMYGLGWYVQDFDGLRLLWHTGCWPPSTSALYLKVPEKDLTFIVLANTANLTAPFVGLGHGDVSKSVLALTFLRYFVFPEQYGSSLPVIDWEAEEAPLIAQLAGVEDEAGREFLERELWSFRQVYAGTGQPERADRLLRVNMRVYPQSDFRSDFMFTQTPAPDPVHPTSVSALDLVWVTRAMAVWLVLNLLSFLWMGLRLLRDRKLTGWGKLLWLASTLFLGLLSILIQRVLLIPNEDGKAVLKRAWGASALVMGGYSTAWILVVALLQSLGSEPNPLVILAVSYLVPLLIGLFLILLPLASMRKGSGWRHLIPRTLLAEVITTNLGFSILFPLTMLISERLLTTLPHPASPFFWGMLSFMAVAGVFVLLPLHAWLAAHGIFLPTGAVEDRTRAEVLPSLRAAWPALLATFVIMVAALALTITQLG